MVERKPDHESWEGFVEQQIVSAQEEGLFDNLPGHGKPIPGLGGADDENWWLKQKMKEEQLAVMPPLLEARHDIEKTLVRIRSFTNEDLVRGILEELNNRVLEAIRSPLPSPPIVVLPVDIEKEVRQWRGHRNTRKSDAANSF